MIANLPHADDVGGDLIEAAKPMLLLGWNAPAVATARCAIDVAVNRVLAEFGLTGSGVRLRDRLDYLQESGLIKRRFRKDLVGLYVDASRASHGGQYALHDSMLLIEQVEEARDVLANLYPEGGAPC